MIRLAKREGVFQLDCILNGERFRGSLRTKDKLAASKLRSRVEVALAEGGRSQAWGDLQAVLPPTVYTRLAAGVGAKPRVSQWADVVSIFRTDCERRIQTGTMARSTLDRYENCLDAVDDYFSTVGITRVDQVTPDVVVDFGIWRKARITAKNNSRGANSLPLDMTVLRNVLSVAVDHGWIDRNPVERQPVHEVVRGAEPFSGEELRLLRDACTEEDMLLFHVFRHTGLRGSDVADLRWSDVDLSNREIVRRTIKRGRKVEIPLEETLYWLLRAAPKAADHVILRDGKPTDRAQLYRWLCVLGRRAGVPNAHPHRFRDTLACDLLVKGATPFEVSRILGDVQDTVEKHYLSFIAPLKDKVRGMMDDRTKGIEAVQKVDEVRA